MNAKNHSRTVSRVTFLRSVEVAYESDGVTKNVVLGEGNVLGNVHGHFSGITLTERPEGVQLGFNAAGWYETWRGIPADALKIEEMSEG
jgi:hypothetical protein